MLMHDCLFWLCSDISTNLPKWWWSDSYFRNTSLTAPLIRLWWLSVGTKKNFPLPEFPSAWLTVSFQLCPFCTSRCHTFLQSFSYSCPVPVKLSLKHVSIIVLNSTSVSHSLTEMLFTYLSNNCTFEWTEKCEYCFAHCKYCAAPTKDNHIIWMLKCICVFCMMGDVHCTF